MALLNCSRLWGAETASESRGDTTAKDMGGKLDFSWRPSPGGKHLPPGFCARPSQSQVLRIFWVPRWQVNLPPSHGRRRGGRRFPLPSFSSLSFWLLS